MYANHLHDATLLVIALLKDHKIDPSINPLNVFTVGTLVRIDDELPRNLRHFTSGKYAVITARSEHSAKYTLFILSKDEEGITHGELTSGYPQEVLTVLGGSTMETLAIVYNADILVSEDEEDDEEDDES